MKCQVCEELEAKHRCRMCGRLVCDLDFNETLGICTVCSATLCEVCRTRLAVGHCANCGRLICRVDSVRVGLSRYCIDCATKLGLIGKVSN